MQGLSQLFRVSCDEVCQYVLITSPRANQARSSELAVSQRSELQDEFRIAVDKLVNPVWGRGQSRHHYDRQLGKPGEQISILVVSQMDSAVFVYQHGPDIDR